MEVEKKKESSIGKMLLTSVKVLGVSVLEELVMVAINFYYSLFPATLIYLALPLLDWKATWFVVWFLFGTVVTIKKSLRL